MGTKLSKLSALIGLLTLGLLFGCRTSQHAGEWHSTEMQGGIRHEVSKMYLDLNPDGTFIAQLEGADADGSLHLKGTYEITGKTLTLNHPEEFEVWSLRFVGDQLRANTGAGVIVFERPSED